MALVDHTAAELDALTLRQEIDQRNWEESHPVEDLDRWEGEGGALAPVSKPSRVTRFLENVGRAHAAQAEAYFASYVHDARERKEAR